MKMEAKEDESKQETNHSMESEIDNVPTDISPISLVIKEETNENCPRKPIRTIFSMEAAVDGACQVLYDDIPQMSLLWHSYEHINCRETMKLCISRLVQQRRPHASADWLEKLLEVSRLIERRLYYFATSIEEYSDPSTLLNRMQNIVRDLVLEANGRLADDPNSSINLPCLTQDDAKSFEYVDEPIEFDEEDKENVEAMEKAAMKFSQKILLQDPSNPLPTMQVSSQGYSRVFIVKVLMSISEFIRNRDSLNSIQFHPSMIDKWLEEARILCASSNHASEELYYGGPAFVESNRTTYWTTAHELYVWWKSNIDRKYRYRIYQEDATYQGVDVRRQSRARWCEAIVSLADSIRSSNYALALKAKHKSARESSNNGNEKDMGTTTETVQETIEEAVQETIKETVTESVDENVKNENVTEDVNDNPVNGMNIEIEEHVIDTKSDVDSNINSLNETENRIVPQLTFDTNVNSNNNVNNESSKARDPIVSGNNGSVPSKLSSSKDEEDEGQIISLYQILRQSSPGDELDLKKENGYISDSNDNCEHIPQDANMTAASKLASFAFPMKLHDMLHDENPDIITWTENGIAFQIKDIVAFVSDILPKYFKHTNFNSFQRQLNLYGFRRLALPHKVYFHPLFLKSRRDLAVQIRRVLPSNEEDGERPRKRILQVSQRRSQEWNKRSSIGDSDIKEEEGADDDLPIHDIIKKSRNGDSNNDGKIDSSMNSLDNGDGIDSQDKKSKKSRKAKLPSSTEEREEDVFFDTLDLRSPKPSRIHVDLTNIPLSNWVSEDLKQAPNVPTMTLFGQMYKMRDGQSNLGNLMYLASSKRAGNITGTGSVNDPNRVSSAVVSDELTVSTMPNRGTRGSSRNSTAAPLSPSARSSSRIAQGPPSRKRPNETGLEESLSESGISDDEDVIEDLDFIYGNCDRSDLKTSRVGRDFQARVVSNTEWFRTVVKSMSSQQRPNNNNSNNNSASKVRRGAGTPGDLDDVYEPTETCSPADGPIVDLEDIWAEFNHRMRVATISTGSIVIVKSINKAASSSMLSTAACTDDNTTSVSQSTDVTATVSSVAVVETTTPSTKAKSSSKSKSKALSDANSNENNNKNNSNIITAKSSNANYNYDNNYVYESELFAFESDTSVSQRLRDSSSPLCVVLADLRLGSSRIQVFDGRRTVEVDVDDCFPFEYNRLLEVFTQKLAQMKQIESNQEIMSLEIWNDIDFANICRFKWSPHEVIKYLDIMKKHNGDARRAFHVLRDTKTTKDIVEFSCRIYHRIAHASNAVQSLTSVCNRAEKLMSKLSKASMSTMENNSSNKNSSSIEQSDSNITTIGNDNNVDTTMSSKSTSTLTKSRRGRSSMLSPAPTTLPSRPVHWLVANAPTNSDTNVNEQATLVSAQNSPDRSTPSSKRSRRLTATSASTAVAATTISTATTITPQSTKSSAGIEDSNTNPIATRGSKRKEKTPASIPKSVEVVKAESEDSDSNDKEQPSYVNSVVKKRRTKNSASNNSKKNIDDNDNIRSISNRSSKNNKNEINTIGSTMTKRSNSLKASLNSISSNGSISNMENIEIEVIKVNSTSNKIDRSVDDDDNINNNRNDFGSRKTNGNGNNGHINSDDDDDSSGIESVSE